MRVLRPSLTLPATGPAGWREDAEEAVGVLQEIHGATKSEKRRYEIEEALRTVSEEAYEKTGSPCGKVLSLLILPEHPERMEKPAGRVLVVYYQYESYLEGNPGQAVTREAVLEAKGGKEYLGKSTTENIQVQQHGNGAGDDVIEIPAEVPAGRYRVFYRWMREGKEIGRSHYVEVGL